MSRRIRKEVEKRRRRERMSSYPVSDHVVGFKTLSDAR